VLLHHGGETTWTPRVDRFNDLYAAGAINALTDVPDPRQWVFTPEVIARFFQMISDQLTIEKERFD
jgi:hypothetical protein